MTAISDSLITAVEGSGCLDPRAAPWDKSTMNANNNNINNNSSTGLDSGSDESSVKTHKRSHRPRGCRGGGSRRARKERRELQFLAKAQQVQNMGYIAVPITTSGAIATFPNKTSVTHYFLSDKSDGPILPSLQSSSSFSSSESEGSFSDKVHNVGNNDRKMYNFDILPSMPIEQMYTSPTKQGMNKSYKTMVALPPLPTNASEAPFTSFMMHHNETSPTFFNDNEKRQNTYTHVHGSPYAQNSQNKLGPPKMGPSVSMMYSQHQTVSYHTTTTSTFATHPIYHQGILTTGATSTHNNNNKVAASTSHDLHNNHCQNGNDDNNNFNDTQKINRNDVMLVKNKDDFVPFQNNNDKNNNLVERIKKQQDMLASGGSFFAMSPKSFLLGKRFAF